MSNAKARQKLDQADLESIFKHTAAGVQSEADPDRLNGRRIIVVDGTGVSMPDTEENQEKWPQYKSQKPGCGFPNAAICACFNLHNGTLLSYEVGNKKSHELPMLRKQWSTFKLGDIFLEDKGFCSYYDQSSFKDRGVDSIITLARRMPVNEVETVKVLGDDEYSASDIAEVYFQRWDVDLFFRDIKITMGMDILRCKTPEMVSKEILMHLIAYNCIRRLMLEAAEAKGVTLRRISFKGSVQALRQWEPENEP